MKSLSTTMALLAAVILTSPVVSFARGESGKYYTPPKGEVQKPAGRAWDRRALGVKFTADRPKKEQMGSADRSAVAPAPAPARIPRPHWGDAAFRK